MPEHLRFGVQHQVDLGARAVHLDPGHRGPEVLGQLSLVRPGARNVRLGSAPDSTVPAASSVPSASTTPDATPPVTAIRATGAPVRICRPCARPAAAMASLIAPIPPMTCPKNPGTASSPPVSRWKTSPIRVPGWYGPPCLPYRLLASSSALACRDSNLGVDELAEAAGQQLRQALDIAAAQPAQVPARAGQLSASRAGPCARVSGGSSRNSGCSRAASARSSACTRPGRHGRRPGEYRASAGRGTRRVGPVGQHLAAVQGHLQGRLARHHAQPVPAQVQRPDNLGPQHAGDVGGGRGPAAGRDLLGHAAAADHVPRLDDQRGQAGPGQQRRRGQPVVPGADHDDVPPAGRGTGPDHSCPLI